MKRILIHFALYFIVTVFILIALGFFIFSLFSFLKADGITEYMAALYCSLIMIGCAFILLLILLIDKKNQCVENKPKNKLTEFGEILINVIKKHPGKAAMAACAIGTIVGRSKPIRKKIIRIVMLTADEFGKMPEGYQAIADFIACVLCEKKTKD